MRFHYKFCIAALLALSNVSGRVVETNDLAHIFNYLEEDTLFAFDLDNTLMETAQHLGSDQWFSYHFNRYLNEEGLSLEETQDKITPLLITVQNRTQMRLVDPRIPEFLSHMREKNIPMIGLTKRIPELSERTFEQMAALQIDFNQTAPIDRELTFQDLQGTLVKKGIIFLSREIGKGAALLAYLNLLEKMPRVIVVDDKLSHIHNIAEVLEPLGVDFIGIRYGGADERVNSFNPLIADLQWEHFHNILSDEQALHLLELGSL
jgi:hypothetical protein